MHPLLLLLAMNLAGSPNYEPNNGPLNASTLFVFEFFLDYVQTHDFQTAADEDWIVFEPPPGRYRFTVTQTTAPPAGSLTLNAQLYDASILANPQALPFAEYNPCPATAGANVTDNDLEFIDPSSLVFLRVRDCFGVTGGDYEVKLDPFEFGSPALPVQISGTVTEAAGMTGVGGVFLVDSTNSATFSSGAGNFSLVTLANTEVTINVFSETWSLVSEVVIPPQPQSSAVSGVSVVVQPVALSLAVADASAGEAQSAAGLQFDVTLEGGTLTEPFAVNYATANGSADATDFAAVAGTLMFAGGNPATQTITVAGIDDLQVEADESFNLTLSLPDPPPQVVLADGVATGTLVNDDTANLGIAPTSAAEEGGELEFAVTLEQAVPVAFSVPYSTADGSAVTGSDFAGVTAATLDFAGTAGEVQTITISSLDDSAVELTESFNVQLGVPTTPLVVVANADAVGELTDNDVAQLSLVAGALAAEGDALSFAVTLAQAVPIAFSVPYSTADGSAVAGSDFTGVTAATLDFAGTAGEVQTITISSLDDSAVELTESFTVQLGVPTTPLVVVANANAVGELSDSDVAQLNLVANVLANEGDPLSFAVTLAQAVPTGFSVPYSTSNGSAEAGSDYTPVAAGMLSFSGNAAEVRTIVIATIEDSTVEAAETFQVQLGSPTFARVQVGNGLATGTILNDDAQQVTTADLTITKDDGNDVIDAGTPLTYTIIAANAGPDDVTDALIVDLAPDGLTGVSWTCQAGAGAACAASGSGDIQQLVDLAAGSQVVLTLDATMPVGSGVITNVATIAEPAAVVDPVPENNSAMDRTATDGVFAASFESPPVPAKRSPGPVALQWRYDGHTADQRWLQTRALGIESQWRQVRRGQDGNWTFGLWQLQPPDL